MKTLLVNTIALFTAIIIISAFTGCTDDTVTNNNQPGTNNQNTFVRSKGAGFNMSCKRMIKTIDGGYICAGQFGPGSNYANDVIIMKLNSQLVTQWVKLFGGSEDEILTSIAELDDGSLLISGTSASFYPATEAFIAKISSSGDSAWAYMYRPSDRFVKTNGYVIAGNENIYFFVFDRYYSNNVGLILTKMNSSGVIEWTKSYAGMLRPDFGTAAPDGGAVFISAGNTLTKIDNTGSVLYSRDYSGTPFEPVFSSFAIDASGRTYLCGKIPTPVWNLTNSLVLCTDNSGQLLWAKAIGTGTISSSFVSLCISGSSVILCGSETFPANNLVTGSVVSVSNNGSMNWSQRINFNKVILNGVYPAGDGGYITEGDFLDTANFVNKYSLMKLREDGNTCFFSQNDSFIISSVSFDRTDVPVNSTDTSIAIVDIPADLRDEPVVDKILCTH